MAKNIDQHELHAAQPVHSVRDVQASAAYYRDVLGFEVDFIEGDPPVHARVSSGDRLGGSAVRIRLERSTNGEPNVNGSYCYIHVGSDLDGLHKAYRDRGVTILRAPENHPWGLRDFYIKDCDGYVFCFVTEAAAQRP